MGISGADSACVSAEPDWKQGAEAEDPACALHAELYLGNCIVRYCKNPLVRDRSGEHTAGKPV